MCEMLVIAGEMVRLRSLAQEEHERCRRMHEQNADLQTQNSQLVKYVHMSFGI